MMSDTIIAVFDTAEHAALAIADLKNSGVPDSAISQHREADTTTTSTSASTGQKPGFWSNLFGGEPERAHDTSVYDRSMATGGSVVSVQAPANVMDQVVEILERHNPVDIDERAAGYQETTATSYATPTAVPAATARPTVDDGVVQLSEESLAVGKRAVNRGTTRVRRYVVETPISEDVTLRDETVSVERRKVADGTAIPSTAFTDKVIEMTETDEEVVVSKTARVVEEVVIKKDVSDRVETVRDTVRRDEVEITKEPGVVTSGTTTPLIDKIKSKL